MTLVHALVAPGFSSLGVHLPDAIGSEELVIVGTDRVFL